MGEYLYEKYKVRLTADEILTDILLYALMHIDDIVIIPTDKAYKHSLSETNQVLYYLLTEKIHIHPAKEFNLLSFATMIRYGKKEEVNPHFDKYIRLKLSGELYDFKTIDSINVINLYKTRRHDTFSDVIKFIMTGDKKILSMWKKVDNLIWDNKEIFDRFYRQVVDDE